MLAVQKLNLQKLGCHVGARINDLNLLSTNVENFLSYYNCFWLNNADRTQVTCRLMKAMTHYWDHWYEENMDTSTRSVLLDVSVLTKEIMIEDKVKNDISNFLASTFCMILSRQERARIYKECDGKDMLYGRCTGPNIHNTCWYGKMFLRNTTVITEAMDQVIEFLDVQFQCVSGQNHWWPCYTWRKVPCARWCWMV